MSLLKERERGIEYNAAPEREEAAANGMRTEISLIKYT